MKRGVVWHHGAWNRNYGDWVLYDSIQHHLCRSAGRALRFVPVDSQRTRYARPLVEKLNAEADMLLVGGGGLIFNRPEDASASGWQFDIALEDLARIKVPIVVYGIGYNAFPYGGTGFPEATDRHLKAVLEKAALFSVRNSGTKRELERRGLDGGRIRVVMDAGAFAPCACVEVPGLPEGVPVIGLNLAGDRPSHRYPPPAEANELKVHRTLAAGLRRAADARGARVLLIPHIVGVDEPAPKVYAEELGRERLVDLKEALPFLYPPAPAGAALLVGVYDRCEAVVAMRGHGCIIPFGRGRPFIGVGSHRKLSFLLDDIGLPGRGVPAEAILDGSVDEAALADRVAEASGDAAGAARMRGALQEARVVFDEWNGAVAALLE